MTFGATRTAGWYDDESDAALLRYWDGSKWSPHTAPKQADAVPEDTVALFRDVSLPPVPPPPPSRAPDEHTTVPLPPEPAASAASVPQFSYEPYRTAGHSFLATWLFAMLLGFWAVDRFYLGKIGTAILKVVTFGGLGIWVFVDLLLVLFGAQRDRQGRPLEGYDEHKRIAWIVTGSLVAFGLVSSVVSNLIARG